MHKRHNSSSRIDFKNLAPIDESVTDGIAENLEEDKLSENSDTKAASKIVSHARKNFLCKNLIE